MAAPHELQGSAVEFYHQAKDKVYKDKASDSTTTDSPSAKRKTSLCTIEEQKKQDSQTDGKASSWRGVRDWFGTKVKPVLDKKWETGIE